MHFERRYEQLLPRGAFFKRLAGYALAAAAILAAALGVGVLGYHHWGRLSWLDSLVNASMILGGMGPVDPIARPAGKWFESIYALFSGVAFLGSVGIVATPLLHRLTHDFHQQPGAPEGHPGSK